MAHTSLLRPPYFELKSIAIVQGAVDTFLNPTGQIPVTAMTLEM